MWTPMIPQSRTLIGERTGTTTAAGVPGLCTQTPLVSALDSCNSEVFVAKILLPEVHLVTMLPFCRTSGIGPCVGKHFCSSSCTWASHQACLSLTLACPRLGPFASALTWPSIFLPEGGLQCEASLKEPEINALAKQVFLDSFVCA